MAAATESMRPGDADAWSASTKRNSALLSIPSYYTSFINEKIDDSESDKTFKEATVVTVRIVPMESVQKANIYIDVEAKGEAAVSIPETWTPNKNEWLIMISLAFISLMVALDLDISHCAASQSKQHPHSTERY
ncbi:hypothetical protein HBH98_066340 [Parastagonospora nodorum]|nr:hypothetical protein HBH98_066340 [Parastagonospora nodorum]KAH4379648.1 hypothetical protein HBH97_100100 [Parastagonospora nodorum]